MMQNSEYQYFTESEIYEIENEEDIKFLKEFNENGIPLVSQVRDKYRINFVGEVITPNNIYFSLPKNIPSSEVPLIKKVLIKYAKDVDGKSLVVNRKGSYTSERAYFNKLKDYFLDFITYEFIYPLKRKKVHSKSTISGGKLSIIDTVRNRDRFGGGITYKTKDVINSDDWMLDDIYYFTIKELEDRLKVSDYEKKQISNMSDYLKVEGYKLNNLLGGVIYSEKNNRKLLDMSNTVEVLRFIKKSDIGIIHNPIKNTLIEYYENKQKASANSSVNVIFTKNFKRVWELILQDALENDDSLEFKNEIKSGGRFNKVEIIEKIIPTDKVEELKKSYPLVESGEDSNLDNWIEIRNGRHFLCERHRLLLPDIFVQLSDGRKFLGDAKYYKDPSDSNYDKEFYIYNDAQENIYPMVIFAVPEEEDIDVTIVPRRGYRRSGLRELIIITVSVKDVIDDAINSKRVVLNDSVKLIEKYTRKENWRKSN